MAFDAGAAVARIELGLAGWKKSVETVKADQKSLTGFAQRHSEGIRKLGTAFTVAGGLIVGALGMAAKSAANAAETTSKFGVIFGPVMAEANKAMGNLAENYGLSEDAARNMLSGTGDLLTGLGMASGEALSLSERTQQLAVDLASFQNYAGGAAGASEALTKGLLGERESLKSLGIVINETMLQERMAAAGKEKLVGMARLQARAEMTLTMATEQSKNALGDYIRTKDSLVNKSRELTARLTDLKNTIGDALLPVIQTLVTRATDIVNKVRDWTKENPELTRTITLATGAVGAMLLVVGPLLIMLPKLVLGIKLLGVAAHAAAGPIGIIAIGLATLAERAITAKTAFQQATAVIDAEAEMTGKKASWLGRTWYALGDVVSKMTGSFIHSGLAQEAMREKLGDTAKGTDGLGESVESLTEYLARFGIEAEQAAGDTGVLAEKVKTLKEQLDLTFTSDLRAKIGLIERALTQYKGQMTNEQEQKLREELRGLKEELNFTATGFRLVETAARSARDFGVLPFTYTVGTTALDAVSKLSYNARKALEGMLPPFVKAKEMAGEMAQAWANIATEIAREWSAALVGMFGLQKALVGEATKHNQDYFNKAMSDIRAEYSAKMELLGLEMGEREKAIRAKYGQEEAALDAEYMNRRKYIFDNIKDENERIEKLKELDSWKSGEEQKLRLLGVEKERELAAELAALHEEEAAETIRLKQEAADEEARILGDQEKSRQDHADNELRRQNSLWTKVKSVFGDAVESMMTTWITGFVSKFLASITGRILPGMEKIGKTGVDVGDTAGKALSGVGKTIEGISKGILGVIEDIAKTVVDIVAYAIETLAKGIAAAARALAAAAPELLIVGAIALALYAGFTAIGAILASGGGGAGDGMGRVVERQDRFLAMFDSWHTDILNIAVYCQTRFDLIIDRLDWIGNLAAGQITEAINNVTAAIGGIPGAAAGAMVMGPALVRVGEHAPRIPEVILPLPELGAFARGMAATGERDGRLGAGAVTVNLSGPMIQTTGVSRVDLERAGETIFEIVEREAGRFGRRLAHV